MLARIGACYNSNMKISELGEFGLIELITKLSAGYRNNFSIQQKNVLIGIGDDAAVWKNESGINLASVDCLIENVHFTLNNIGWKELGWKALAVSLSDIAAMGGIPQNALISLALPQDTEVEDIVELYNGIFELGEKFDVNVIGGNISKAPVVFIDSIIFGTAPGPDFMLTRSTAKPGDLIAIIGYLGGATGGLKMLKNNLQFTDETKNALREALNKPFPAVTEGQLLVKWGVKCAMDISDGLLADLEHICKASYTGAVINTDLVPIHPAVKSSFGDTAIEIALSGGEDYKLLFTASKDIIEKIKKGTNCPVTIIGEIVSDKGCKIILKDKNGDFQYIQNKGWDHFAK